MNQSKRISFERDKKRINKFKSLKDNKLIQSCINIIEIEEFEDIEDSVILLFIY